VRILLDENLDWRLERHLPGHDVSAVPRIGWAGMKNGKLLEAASQRFDALITMDGSLLHQQDLTRHNLIVVGLRAASNRLADTAPLMSQVLALLPTAEPGRMHIVPPNG
jgi:hypothetical protein